MQSPLVDQKYKLEKVQGKGGWTFVVIAEVAPNKELISVGSRSKEKSMTLTYSATV
jgi:hypothetical protein